MTEAITAAAAIAVAVGMLLAVWGVQQNTKRWFPSPPHVDGAAFWYCVPIVVGIWLLACSALCGLYVLNH